MTRTKPQLRARDAMSAPLVVLRDYDTLWRAVDRFIASGLRHLVVLDDGNALVGVLDDRRVLAEWPIDATGLHHHTVGQLLRAGQPTGSSWPRVHPMTSIRSLAERMLELRVDALPVVDDSGTVVGIVTSSDLVRSLAVLAAEAEEAQPEEAQPEEAQPEPAQPGPAQTETSGDLPPQRPVTG